MIRATHIIFVLALGLAAWVTVMPPGPMTQDQGLTFGIMLMTLTLWGTGIVPGYVGAAFLMVALLLTGLQGPDVVFGSFSSSATWLVVAGFVIGAAITHTGLGRRLGELARPHVSGSYAALIIGLAALGMMLNFMMPSSLGRASVLVPVGMALADALGLEKGSTGRTGVAVIMALATNTPGFAILPANIPNLVLSGVVEQSLGLHFSYAHYLLLHFPVLGLLKSAATVAIVLVSFPGQVKPEAAATGMAPTSARRQLVLLAILLVTLGFWTTDQLHGINPAWIGLATALVLMTPQFGFVPPPVFKASVDFSTLLFVAGVMTLGTVVNGSGLGTIIARAVFANLPMQQGQDFVNFMSLALLGAGTSVFTTMAGVPAVLTPLTERLAENTGFTANAVLMTQVVGFSSLIFPYQAAPLMVAMGLAGESTRPLARVVLLLFIVSVLVLMPLEYLWWKVLGEI